MTDPVKAAYTKGYNAGRRRTEGEMEEGRRHWEAECAEGRAVREALYREAFGAVLGALVSGNGCGWKMGNERVNSLDDYIELSKRFALKAVSTMPNRI